MGKLWIQNIFFFGQLLDKNILFHQIGDHNIFLERKKPLSYLKFNGRSVKNTSYMYKEDLQNFICYRGWY